MKKKVALDVETFCPVEELPQEEIEYLRRRKEYSSEEDFQRDLAVNPYVSLLISFALFYMEEDRVEVYFLSGDKEEKGEAYPLEERSIYIRYYPVPFAGNLQKAEKRLLEIFWEKLGGVGHLITFHGKSFDMEFVRIRTMIHGLTCKNFFRYMHHPSILHTDMRDLLKAGRENYSLNFLARRLNLPVSKGRMDGSGIRDAFLAEDYHRIARYNAKDALMTGLLYERLKDYVLVEHMSELLRGAGFSEGNSVVEYTLQRDLLSSREASRLLDMRTSASQRQKEYLQDLLKRDRYTLEEVCSAINYDTILKIIGTADMGEIT